MIIFDNWTFKSKVRGQSHINIRQLEGLVQRGVAFKYEVNSLVVRKLRAMLRFWME